MPHTLQNPVPWPRSQAAPGRRGSAGVSRVAIVTQNACAQGDGEDAAARLNTLLMQHPVHPQLSGHDRQPWHVHYTESGSVADKYAAGAVMGLAVRLTDVGIDRFGICQAAGCPGVFIDISTSNTRRYCSERCMNRANVSAFRARKRGEDDGEAKAPTTTA